MINLRFIITLIIFFIGSQTYASEVTFKPLEGVIKKDTIIIQGKIIKIESKEEANFVSRILTVSDIKVINGSVSNNIKTLIHKRVIPILYDKNGNKIGHFSSEIEASGIEFSLVSGKTYMYFAEAQDTRNGTLEIFRIEPIENKTKTLNILRDLNKKLTR